MLGTYYRLIVYYTGIKDAVYNSGARIEAHWIPWKLEEGGMVQGSEESDTTAFLNTGETATVGDVLLGTVVDNRKDMYMGFTGTFYFKASETLTNYPLGLYLEQSTDNSRWPSGQADFNVQLHCHKLCDLQKEISGLDPIAMNFFYS